MHCSHHLKKKIERIPVVLDDVVIATVHVSFPETIKTADTF